MGKRNIIYENFDFACTHKDDKTGKPCNSHLHLTNQYGSTLEFKCFTCGKYTCMSYQISNITDPNTGKAPKKHR